MKAAAEKMNDILWEVLETTARKNLGNQATKVMIPGLQAQSYQEWVIRQPIRLGGLGLRSQIDPSPAAFIGAVEQVLPSFVGTKGVCMPTACSSHLI